MLDPLTALALTGNVLQFIDFGLKATSKAREVYLSADGITTENADLEVLTTDIASVSEKLVASSGNSSGNDSLDDISRRCKAVADDLLVALRKLKVEGRKGKWKSARKGLKAVWGKRKVDDLRIRLESWRDEIQFHVVLQLRNDIDAEAIRNSERFGTLDEHAKAIIVAISETENTIRQAMVVESDSSEQRHKDTRAALLGEHIRTREHFQEAILVESGNAETRYKQTKAVMLTNSTEVKEEICNTIRVEGENSSQRHSRTQEIIVAKQTEAQVEITQALDTLDSNLQAEQEASRRELEQLKVAMKQIEKDMARRDEELKILIIELSKTHTEKEKKRLQERSNAVTIALYALITVYESLQSMFVALQSQAKMIIASKSWRGIWETKIPQRSYGPETGIQLVVFEDVLNYTTQSRDNGDRDRIIESAVRELCSPVWEALDSRSFEGSKYQWRLEADGPRSMVNFQNGALQFTDLSKLRFGSEPNSGLYDGLGNLIIISTLLEHALGSVSSTVELMRSLNEGGRHRRRLPFHSSHEFKLLVTEWTKAGRFIGYRAKAEELLELRCAKWGIDDSAIAKSPQGARKLYRWLFLEIESETCIFDIVSLDGGRAGGAALFAIVEYFIHFGFRLTAPVMTMTEYGLQAHVSRDEQSVTVLPAEASVVENELQTSQDLQRRVLNQANRVRQERHLPLKIKEEARVLENKLSRVSTLPQLIFNSLMMPPERLDMQLPIRYEGTLPHRTTR